MPEFIIESAEEWRRAECASEDVVIGRDPTCDLVIADPSVSRRHARIVRRDGRWIVEDLGSGNGTLLDGTRTARAQLHRGSVIGLGAANVTFLGEPGDERAAADTLLEDDHEVDREDVPRVAPRVPTGDAHGGAAASAAEGSPSTGAAAPRRAREAGEGSDEVAPTAPVLEGVEAAVLQGFDPLGPVWEGARAGRRLRLIAVSPDLARDARFETWLLDAIREWSGLGDPSLSPVAIERTSAGEIVLVEEAEGTRDLASRLQSERRLDQVEVARFGVQMAGLLQRLHDGGVRIFGMRPGRFVQDEGGTWRLAFSRLPLHALDTLDVRGLDGLRSLPPEVFDADGRLGEETDVYGLAAVMHHALIGMPVADGRTLDAVRASVARGSRKNLEQRAPRLVEDFPQVLGEALAPAAAERPRLDDLLKRLRGVSERAAKTRQKGQPIAVEERERDIGERPMIPKKSLRYRLTSWAVTGLIIVVLNGLLLLGFVLLQPGGCDKIPPDTDEGFAAGDGTGSTPASQAPQRDLTDRIDAHLDGDRFDEAGSLIMSAQRRGELSEDEVQTLRQRIRSRRDRRALDLTEKVESALQADDRGAAKLALRRLERIVGSQDPVYRRLQALVESH